MKKLVLVLAVAFSGVLNAQTVITESQLNSINSMFDELNFRRELGAYVLNKTEKFEPVLKKFIEGRLNLDSLESKQRALYRIGINENFDGTKPTSILTYLSRLDINRFSDTSTFVIKYDQSELGAGNKNETVEVYNKLTNERVLLLHMQFETYSNLIYSLIVKNGNVFAK
jgi:hypothetical protein